MKIMTLIFLIIVLNKVCQPQEISSTELVGGSCEGCEAIFEFGEAQLTSVDTLIDFNKAGLKLKITGTVYKNNGITPAEGVILYIYHTNQEGIYPTLGNEEGWAKRHGYIRGWIKTDKDGRYTFYTLKPGIYPSGREPAHIHITILEPDGKYYWIESYHFADDSFLSKGEKRTTNSRGGGSNILYLEQKDGIMVGKRNIITGKNIPGYK